MAETATASEGAKRYKWRNGTRSRGFSAQVFGEWLESQDDEVTAEHVVRAALDPKEMIYGLLPSEAECVKEHRLWQARHFLAALRSVEIIVEVIDNREEPREVEVYAYQHVPEVKAYVRADVVAANDEYRRSALNECISKLRGLRKRYDWLNELASVWREIDRLDPDGRKAS